MTQKPTTTERQQIRRTTDQKDNRSERQQIRKTTGQKDNRIMWASREHGMTYDRKTTGQKNNRKERQQNNVGKWGTWHDIRHMA